MSSSEVDSNLYLTTDTLSIITRNDDSGSGFDAQITQLLAAGTYRVLANSATQSAEVGSYKIITSSSSSDDFDGDGILDDVDPDDDNDGVDDIDDAFPRNPSETKDSDGDGIGDNSEIPIRLTNNKVIHLPVVGRTLVTPDGATVTVPNTATGVVLNVTVVNPSAAGFITVWPCGVNRPNASNVNFVKNQIVPNGVVASIGDNGEVCFFSSVETDLVVDVAGWFAGDVFVGATPTRLVDSRISLGTASSVKITPSQPLVVRITDVSVNLSNGVPSQVPSVLGAAALNITVVDPIGAGFVTVYPCDVARPEASNLNFVGSQIIANGLFSPVSNSGEVCIFSSRDTHIIVDLAGWFDTNFKGSTPKRLVDTRNGTGGRQGKVVPASILEIPIRGKNLIVQGSLQSVPVAAVAAALNVTTVGPDGAGFVTLWPCGVSRPLASNLNFVTDLIVANNVLAPIGSNGSVCLFVNVDSHIVVDVSGWFEGNASNGFVGTTPTRLIDTRNGTGPPPK